MDYFYGRLHVSPGRTRLASTGWVWHPVGMVRSLALDAWLGGEVFASETDWGQAVAVREYAWDALCCWLDEQRLAVWGFGNEDENLVDAVSIFDVNSGKLVQLIGGVPRGELVLNGDLYSMSPEQGCTVWDLESGFRIGADPDCKPHGYHPEHGCFLTCHADALIIDRITPV